MNSREGVEITVSVNGVANPFLRALWVTRSCGAGALDSAGFELDLGAAGRYVEDMALAAGGEEVEIIGIVDGLLTSFFWGTISVGSIELGSDEKLQYTARVEPYHLGLLMTGAYYNLPGSGPTVIQLDPVFNPLIDGVALPNRSVDESLYGPAYVFVDPESARTTEAQTLQGGEPEYWTLSDAVNYLCWSLNPDQLFVLNPTQVNLDFLPAVALYNVSLKRGEFLGQYLDQLLNPWGWTWSIAILAPGMRQIVLFQRGVGVAKSALLQSHGSVYDGDNVEQARFDYNVGSTRNNLTVSGDWHYFESTFVLQRAWPASNDGTSSVALSQDLASWQASPTLHRVWRDWVLDEAGDYIGTRPEIVAAFDFGSLLGHPVVPRRQRFLPTLTLDPDGAPVGQHFGVSIDYSIDGGSTWRPIKQMIDATVQILTRECGVRFDGLQVPIELYQAGDKAKVRVTATLRDDLRLGINLANDATSPLEVSNPILVDTSDRHHWREVLPSSKYYANVSAGALKSNQADDSAELAVFAATLKAAWDVADVSGEIAIEGLDATQYGLGDLIVAVDGRAISLAASAVLYPQIVSITYDFQSQKRTLRLETFSLPESAISGSARGGMAI